MSCKSCGHLLEVFEYQSRSADEAHSVSQKCPYCPLDIEKLYSERNYPFHYLQRRSRNITRTQRVVIDKKTSCKMLIASSFDKNLVQCVEFDNARAVNVLDQDSRLFKVYTSGPWTGMGISYARSTKLTLNMILRETHTFTQDIPDCKEYIDFEYTMIDEYICVRQNDSFLLYKMLIDDDDVAILEHVNAMYLNGFCPSSLDQYINKIDLGSMSNLTARAYDANTVEDYTYNCSTKPDGERVWIVKTGSVWLYCRRLLGFSVIAFDINLTLDYIDTSNSRFLMDCVIDVELMLSHPPILIDILYCKDRTLSPYNRNLQWINSEIQCLKSTYPYLRMIHEREFFDTLKAAEEYKNSVAYPTDGLVAISKSGTDMKKIKNVKSMELALGNDAILYSRDSVPLMKIADSSKYLSESIIEVRFTIDRGSFEVHEHFQRFDKNVANDSTAINSIIRSCISTRSESETRISLWRWSNTVRRYIYKLASTKNPDRSIVLDIGSGSGQSSEAFDQLSECSFILVEPDSNKCNALSRRLQVKSVDKNPRSIITSIPSLRKGLNKYHIVNASLNDILTDKPTMNNIKSTIKCAVACFSTQYIVDSIQLLTEVGIPFIGSYYSYYDLEVGGHIINHGGISMVKNTDTTAVVKWGNDKEYTEPVIDESLIPVSISSIPATDFVQAPVSIIEDPIHIACSHVRILRSL